jgi:hypothetical protein
VSLEISKERKGFSDGFRLKKDKEGNRVVAHPLDLAREMSSMNLLRTIVVPVLVVAVSAAAFVFGPIYKYEVCVGICGDRLRRPADCSD